MRCNSVLGGRGHQTKVYFVVRALVGRVRKSSWCILVYQSGFLGCTVVTVFSSDGFLRLFLCFFQIVFFGAGTCNARRHLGCRGQTWGLALMITTAVTKYDFFVIQCLLSGCLVAEIKEPAVFGRSQRDARGKKSERKRQACRSIYQLPAHLVYLSGPERRPRAVRTVDPAV